MLRAIHSIKRIFASVVHCIKRNPVLAVVISIAFALYMVAVMPSGRIACIEGRCGLHFWGAHEHDGVWHVALAQVAFRHIPFSFPTFAGAHLSGYNYLLDVVIWMLSLTGLSVWDLYFRILPFVWFCTFIYVLSKYAKMLHPDPLFKTILFFFIFFYSSFGFIIQLVRNGNIEGSSGIPTMQGALGMTNPQFMWSVVLLMALQLLLHHRTRVIYLFPVIFAILGLKIYALVPVCIVMAMSCLQLLWKHDWRRFSWQMLVGLLATISAYVVFYAGNKSGGIFFDFLAVPKQLIEDPQMWHQPDLVHQWYTLKQIGTIGPKYIQVVLQIIFYFLFFNFGVRLLFVIPLGYYLYKKNTGTIYVRFVLTLLVIVSTLMPILFIQSGDWWNTIQFAYFGFLFASILLADLTYLVWKRNRILGGIFIFGCVLMFLPAQVDILTRFMFGKSSYIAIQEVGLLEKLGHMKQGTVLVQPFEQSTDDTLATTYDTAYVSALSGKVTYLADRKQLELLNIDYKSREMELGDRKDCVDMKDIHYVYLRKTMRTFAHFDSCVLKSKQFEVSDENALSKLWTRR